MSDRNRILCEFRNKTKSIMGDSLKQMIKMNIEVFSDGSEQWDDITSGKNKDGAAKFYGKINNIEKQLVDSKITFQRIHQSYPVN